LFSALSAESIWVGDTAQKILSWVKPYFWFGLIISQVSGCATPVRNLVPDGIPYYVREIKTVRVQADGNWIDTGIELRPGEFLSVMATGKIRQARSSRVLYPSSCACLLLQVADSTPTLALLNRNARTFPSSWEGTLSFKITESQASFLSAHFDVTVVIWSTNDYFLIAEFLKRLEKAAPDHPGIYEASIEASTLRDLQLEKEATSDKIEETRNQIAEIKSNGVAKPGSEAAQRVMRLHDLQGQLEALMAKVAEIDALARQIQEQRDLSANLTRQLLEKDRREKDLASRASAIKGTPPLLLIASPENDGLVEAQTVALTGIAEDDRGLQRLEVILNGSLVDEKDSRSFKTGTLPPLRLNFERQIFLSPGANRILVKATDIDSLVTEKTVIVHYLPNRRNVWAVVVGINNYKKFPKLKYAVNDAKEFYRLLLEKNRIPAENVTLLIDEQATLKNLKNALGMGLKIAAGPDDMVLIYFAGHGASERDATSIDGDGLEKYILPFDTDPEDLFSTALPMRDIALVFNRIRSERLIFIADTCYSGASGGRTVGTGGIRANISDTFLEQLAGGRGKVIITASAANEVSVEKDEFQHGVFTYYLLEGLRGAADNDRDGSITVDEAYRYVSERVPRATGQEQHPVKKGSVEGNLIMSIVR
jgi:hypothetical protein